jgi:endonuclease-3 related protein
VLTAIELLERLLGRYGPQGWWPAQSAFEVMVGAVLVQRTSWLNAARALERLDEAGLLHWEQIAACDPAILEGLIRPAGFFRTKARRLIGVADYVRGHGGTEAMSRLMTGELRRQLLGLFGVGAETADAILLYAFERPVFVDDAYARRLLGRLHGRKTHAHDVATFVRDLVDAGETRKLAELHALVVEHSKQHCRSSPACEQCVLRARCVYPATDTRPAPS